LDRTKVPHKTCAKAAGVQVGAPTGGAEVNMLVQVVGLKKPYAKMMLEIRQRVVQASAQSDLRTPVRTSLSIAASADEGRIRTDNISRACQCVAKHAKSSR
jgi:hypothetical protein